MLRVAAGRHVAQVHDRKSLWRLAMSQDPRVAMGGHPAVLANPGRPSYPAVAVPLQEAGIEPAAFRVGAFVHLRPEPLRPSPADMREGACTAAEAAAVEVVLDALERLPALLAMRVSGRFLGANISH